MNPEVLSPFGSGDQLASQAAADLASKILSLVGERHVHVALTGGTIGIKTLTELAPLLVGKDLSKLHFWWGDDRFVEDSSRERNYVQASEVLLSKITMPPENIHPMPSKSHTSLADAASLFAVHYEAVLPKFDVVLLGMGADGHVASLFPDSNPVEHGKFVVSEANSPKPPEQRISLSFQALSDAREVWFLVSGSDKAAAVREALSGVRLPASRVSGQELTRWYLDEAAAKELTS